MDKSIEEFLKERTLEKSNSNRFASIELLKALPEIQKHRAQGYTKKIIWEYMTSEGKIPPVCYSWFSIWLSKHEKQLSNPKIDSPKKEHSTYEPRKSNYVEPNGFTVTSERKSPEEYFSKKIREQQRSK